MPSSQLLTGPEKVSFNPRTRVRTVEHQILLHPKQEEFVFDPSPNVAFIGGRGSGKSYAGAVKDLNYCLQEKGCILLVGAPSYPILRDTTIPEFFKVCPPDLISSYNKNENILTLTCGSEIWYRSLHDPDRVRGVNAHALHVDEAGFVAEEAWRIASACVRVGTRTHKWITTTPKGKNWIYRDWVEKVRAGYTLYRSRSSDNPFLPPDFEASLRYSGQFFRQEVLGLFEKFEGLVYALWDRLSCVKRLVQEKLQKVMIGVDWGYRNPATLVVVGERMDRSLYIPEEWYYSGGTIDDQVKAAQDLQKRYNTDYIRVQFVADPSRPDNIEVFNRAGLPCIPAHNEIVAGVSKVASYLPMVEGGPSTLIVDPSCIHGIAEFEEYSYGDNLKASERNPAEKPLDMANHFLDALRYAIMALSTASRRDIWV